MFNLQFQPLPLKLSMYYINMVDRMYIGHLPGVGANALTGVGRHLSVIMAISAFAALVSMGGAPRASIMLGKAKDEAENILGNCTTALIVVAVVSPPFSSPWTQYPVDVRRQRQYH